MNQYITKTLNNHETISIIKEKISSREPFCLSRFGDAEIMILRHSATDSLKQKICSYWKYNIDEWQQINSMLKDIINFAILNSDINGFLFSPDEIGEKCKASVRPEHWLLTKEEEHNLNSSNKIKYCSHQITRREALGDPNKAKGIFQNNNIAIIHPDIEGMQRNKIHELLNCDIEYIKSYNDRGKMLSILPKINSQIVLYGCSIVGKDYGAIMKNEYNKIAIDYGATLDGWAGIATRPWFSPGMSQQHCLIKT